MSPTPSPAVSSPEPLRLLAQGLAVHARQFSLAQLGDRSGYVGMSDVGRATDCLRAAVASKLASPQDQKNNESLPDDDALLRTLRRELILQRGHWQESGIAAALKSTGQNLIPQLEIEAACSGTPVKAHLDLTLVHASAGPTVQVLELKSNERLPETLYGSYELQLYGQIGLLELLWNRPCFGLRDEDGRIVVRRQTFPQIVRLLFGLDLPTSPKSVAIEGWALCVAMSDAKAFGPYLPNKAMLGHGLRLATTLWNTIKAIRDGAMRLDDVPTCAGFHPLCDWCAVNATCPKFRPLNIGGQPVELDPEHASALSRLETLKERKSSLEKDIVALEERIRHAFHRLAGQQEHPGWLTAGDYRFRVTTQPGRRTIDQAALLAELLALTGAEEAATQVLGRIQKTGRPFERLTVSRVQRG